VSERRIWVSQGPHGLSEADLLAALERLRTPLKPLTLRMRALGVIRVSIAAIREAAHSSRPVELTADSGCLSADCVVVNVTVTGRGSIQEAATFTLQCGPFRFTFRTVFGWGQQVDESAQVFWEPVE
jgi:hypothetical protein